MAKSSVKRQQEIDAFSAWRDEMRRQPRIMTQAEYAGWCRAGDLISSPISSGQFAGGLAIVMNGARGKVFGVVEGWCEPPKGTVP